MKVLFVNGSPRMNGNTRAALEAIIAGARENKPEFEIEMLDVSKHKILGCVACESCKKKGGCVLDDETNPLVQKVIDADCVILGTPVYWWGMSAQLKLFIDKWYARGAELAAMKKTIGLVTVGAAETSDREYALIHGQMECICDYMGWNLVFSEAICASDPGDVGKQASTLAHLRALYQTV